MSKIKADVCFFLDAFLRVPGSVVVSACQDMLDSYMRVIICYFFVAFSKFCCFQLATVFRWFLSLVVVSESACASSVLYLAFVPGALNFFCSSPLLASQSRFFATGPCRCFLPLFCLFCCVSVEPGHIGLCR